MFMIDFGEYNDTETLLDDHVHFRNDNRRYNKFVIFHAVFQNLYFSESIDYFDVGYFSNVDCATVTSDTDVILVAACRAEVRFTFPEYSKRIARPLLVWRSSEHALKFVDFPI